ncbi:MAG TPA: choice-of-anchor Q domain-containing protein [Acidimicrobiia bacterium]|nr:choice-of-anchor Q domain-containing protein [Acidimicrobiia bacterium]
MMRQPRGFAALVAALAAIAVWVPCGGVAAAAGCGPTDIVVTNNLDGAGPPAGSLRAAFATASATGGPQTICVAAGVVSPIMLTTAGGGELVYNAGTTPDLTVQGNGITVHAAPNDRVVNDETTGPLRLDTIVITGGNAGGPGGGVSTGGDLALSNATVEGNTAAGRGGGVSAVGNVTVTSSLISANTAGFDGGGICAFGTATVTASTIADNAADNGGDGGGVCAFGAMTVTNSTVTGNSAAGDTGGGLDTNEALTLVYSTVVQNTAANGANLGFLTLASFGSAVALPSGGSQNCALPGTSNGFNFTDDVSCDFSAAETHAGVNPDVGAVTRNGGPTPTRLPQAGSPLIDAIPASSCELDGAAGITRDQRGLARPDTTGGPCDIGAVEVQAARPTPVGVTPRFTG